MSFSPFRSLSQVVPSHFGRVSTSLLLNLLLQVRPNRQRLLPLSSSISITRRMHSLPLRDAELPTACRIVASLHAEYTCECQSVLNEMLFTLSSLSSYFILLPEPVTLPDPGRLARLACLDFENESMTRCKYVQ